jgi:predicted transcriptional regulator
MREWTLISHHGLVLASISRDQEKTAREISKDVGITERTTHKIIIDLEQGGYISRVKNGRRNVYRIHPDMPLRNTMSDAAVGELLELFGWHPRKSRKVNEGVKKHSLTGVG